MGQRRWTETIRPPIEKGIPIPEDNRGKTTRYRWDEMEVGDSFFVPRGERQSNKVMNGAIAHQQKKTGKKFTYRPWTEGEVEGVRVWRIS